MRTHATTADNYAREEADVEEGAEADVEEGAEDDSDSDRSRGVDRGGHSRHAITRSASVRPDVAHEEEETSQGNERMQRQDESSQDCDGDRQGEQREALKRPRGRPPKGMIWTSSGYRATSSSSTQGAFRPRHGKRPVPPATEDGLVLNRPQGRPPKGKIWTQRGYVSTETAAHAVTALSEVQARLAEIQSNLATQAAAEAEAQDAEEALVQHRLRQAELQAEAERSEAELARLRQTLQTEE